MVFMASDEIARWQHDTDAELPYACTWDNVVQHGSHTPEIGRPLAFHLSYNFYIGHKRYGQLTAAKTRYLLTSIT